MSAPNKEALLLKLIQVGLLETGEGLFCPMPSVQAVICSEGIFVRGRTFDDPTEAMQFVMGSRSEMDNGWTFWKVSDPVRGFVKPLEHLRIQLLSISNKEGVRTSETHPLRIDVLETPNVAGKIGMTFLPGKKGDALYGPAWDRCLDADVGAINVWNPDFVLTLMEDHEFGQLGVPDFKAVMSAQKFRWVQIKIRDSDIPRLSFEMDWPEFRDEIVCLLKSGGKILIHCRGGLGRTGMIAAGLLTEFGFTAEQAINGVRRVREGTLETWEQEQYVGRLVLLSEKWRALTKFIISTSVYIVEADLIERLRTITKSPDALIEDWFAGRQIFYVNYQCRRYYPTYAFLEGNISKPVLNPILETFTNRSAWGIAGWFASPCGFLGNRRPQEVITENLDVVIRAAKDSANGIQHG